MPVVDCDGTPFVMTTGLQAIYPVLAGAFVMSSSMGADLPTTAEKELYIPFYSFTLTGQPNIEIPISSFQARYSDSGAGFLSVVIPGVDYADEITARADGGKLQVFKNYYDSTGAVSKSEMIAEAVLDDLRLDEGTRKKSITLSGHKDTVSGGAAITLSGVVDRKENDGLITLVFAEPDLYLRPGDVLTAGDDVITVDKIRYSVNPSYQSMEVDEAAA
ncbi:hypothetical protein ACFLZM_08145 [Thermodesulfobacteriota bacterium]